MQDSRTQHNSPAAERPSHSRRGLLRAAILLCALALLAVLSVTASAAPTCTDTFTGTSGGNWALAGNWTTASATHLVPSMTDVVCLGSSTVVVSNGAQEAGSIADGTGSLDITGGSLTLTSTTAATAISNFALDDTGSFTAPATQTVTVTGDFEWGQESTNEQEQLLNAVINQTGGGSFSIDGDPSGSGLGGPLLTGAAAVTTSSPVSITNGLFGATGAQTLTTTGTITLGEVQLDALTSQATITAAAIAVQPANSGTYGFWDANLVLTGGSTEVAINTTLLAGNVTLQSGTIDAVGDIGPPPGYPLDTMTLDTGLLTGSGVIYENAVNVGATVTPLAGTGFSLLTVTGTYTQDPAGTIAIGIDETDTGILRAYGAATLAGTIFVTDLAGAPSPGQEFNVVLDSSTSGTVSLTGPSAAEYAVSYPTGGSGGAVRLTALAPPPPPGKARCAEPTGRLGGLSLGPLDLGFTRAHARRTLKRFSVTKSGLDDFCLRGERDIRVAYATKRILAEVPEELRASLRGKLILAVTDDPFYSLDNAKPGERLSKVAERLHLRKKFVIDGSDWYVLPGELANGLLKVRAGVIVGVGLANRRLTSTQAAQRRLLKACGAA